RRVRLHDLPLLPSRANRRPPRPTTGRSQLVGAGAVAEGRTGTEGGPGAVGGIEEPPDGFSRVGRCVAGRLVLVVEGGGLGGDAVVRLGEAVGAGEADAGATGPPAPPPVVCDCTGTGRTIT